MATRKANNGLVTKWYIKSTLLDKILNYHSNHPLNKNTSTIKTVAGQHNEVMNFPKKYLRSHKGFNSKHLVNTRINNFINDRQNNRINRRTIQYLIF